MGKYKFISWKRRHLGKDRIYSCFWVRVMAPGLAPDQLTFMFEFIFLFQLC